METTTATAKTETPQPVFRLRIERDQDAESPREDDNLGIMVCWHGRYDLGDENMRGVDPSEWFAGLADDVIALPLYLYAHGGITMSTGGFSDSWDSGQVGWIYAETEKIRECFMLEKDAPIDTEMVLASLRSEVEVYDTYLRGDVWVYTLEQAETCKSCEHTTWEHVESCGGIYNGEDMEEHLHDMLPSIPDAKAVIEKAWDDRE